MAVVRNTDAIFNNALLLAHDSYHESRQRSINVTLSKPFSAFKVNISTFTSVSSESGAFLRFLCACV